MAVAALPIGALVEIEAWAVARRGVRPSGRPVQPIVSAVLPGTVLQTGRLQEVQVPDRGR